MTKVKPNKKLNPVAKELRTPKFKKRVIPNKKKIIEKKRIKLKF